MINLPTLIVLVVIIAICTAIVVKGIINRKRGKTSCSCGCGGCAMADVCHNNKNKK